MSSTRLDRGGLRFVTFALQQERDRNERQRQSEQKEPQSTLATPRRDSEVEILIVVANATLVRLHRPPYVEMASNVPARERHGQRPQGRLRTRSNRSLGHVRRRSGGSPLRRRVGTVRLCFPPLRVPQA